MQKSLSTGENHDATPSSASSIQSARHTVGAQAKRGESCPDPVLGILPPVRWLVGLALLVSACGGSSTAPSAPSVTSSSTTTTTIPAVQTIQTSTCPTSGPPDLGFYQEIGCNFFEQPAQPVRRWTLAPKLYLRTIDEAGAAIDAVTLDTVQNAMIEIAPVWTNHRFGLEGVLRGTDSREGAPGWITVKWPATAAADSISCGRAQVAVDGGWIELNYKATACACNGSAIRPLTARHELGHAFGYWHTDSPGDLMNARQAGCDAQPSARELQAAAYQYR